MLKLYVDFKAPAAYLAVRPSLALFDKLALDVEWRPLRTVQHAIPSPAASDQKPEIHRRVRAIARRNTHLLYADVQGVTMRFQDPPGETDVALAAMTRIPGSARAAFVEAAFRAYWVDGDNLNDPGVVTRLLQASGQNPGCLDGLDVAATLARAQDQARADGVVDAPAYVIDEQVFVGREHLPLIESIVTSA